MCVCVGGGGGGGGGGNHQYFSKEKSAYHIPGFRLTKSFIIRYAVGGLTDIIAAMSVGTLESILINLLAGATI